jgi:Ger(x)C family germination protein
MDYIKGKGGLCKMKKCIIFIFILMSGLLSGCWDKIELEELGYVAAIGVDKGEGGNISVTFQIQNPQVGSSERAKAENEPAFKLITFEAADIISARDTASANVARRLDFSHANALILSEEFARSEDCYKHMGEMLRNREIRGEINLIVSRESASEFIRHNKPPMETRPMKFYDLISKRWHESGITPSSTLHGFMQRTEQDLSLYLAIYATTKKDVEKKLDLEDEYIAGEIKMESDNPVQLIGSAVFRNGKMIGTINGEETRFSMMFRQGEEFSGIMAVLNDPIEKNKKITARLYKQKQPKIKMDLKGDRPKIEVTVFVEYETVLIPSHIDYVENLENQKLLKTAIKNMVEGKAQKLIEKTQTEFEGEPFIWGSTVRKKFLKYDDFAKYEWMNKYSSAEVKINYDIKLRGFGKELRPSDLNKIED